MLFPLAVMVTSVLYLSLQHASLRALWVAFAGALASGLLVAKDWNRYAAAAVRGLADSLFGMISLAILLASIIGSILKAGGVVQSAGYFAIQSGISGNGYILLTFVVTAAIGVSTGSAGATILTVGPILYPVGCLIGADPAFLVGAITSGGALGDNMAPIGNTSIVSAATQDAEIIAVVRARLKYSVPCALLTGGLFFLLPPVHSYLTQIAAEQAVTPAASALLLLLAPVAVIVTAIRRNHILISLTIGILVGLGSGIAAGRFSFSDIMSNPGGLKTTGMVIEGISNSLDIVVAGLFLFPLINVLVEGGIRELALGFLQRFVRGVRSAEASIVTIVLSLGIVTATDTLSVLLAGPVAKDIGLRFGIGRNRRANLMECASIVSFVLPYGVASLLGAQLSQRFSPSSLIPPVSPLSVGSHTIYPLVMLGMVTIAILTGYGRRAEEDGERTAI